MKEKIDAERSIKKNKMMIDTNERIEVIANWPRRLLE